MEFKRILKSATVTGSICFSMLSSAGQVGTTTGAFQVTAGGQSAYTMSVEVPPGIMGVVPQVAITYSSSGGNGLLGMGANLAGLSSITRCGKTFEQDNVSKAIQYDNTDFFCLNGQRLILMSGTYGGNGATYQTELESFQRVTSRGAAQGGGPTHFEVLGKGGSKLVFGNSLSTDNFERSIDPVSNSVASWGISYLEDKHGNRVIYEYEDASRTQGGETANQILPKRITYGHNTAANVVGNLAVEFSYESREDTARGYARGQKFISDVRLSNIKTYVGNDVVKDYRVTYALSPVSNRSRITHITECSGEGNCLLPIELSWTDYSPDWEAGSNLPAAALTADGRMRGTAVDVNNDGHTDWVMAVRDGAGSDALQTFLNENGSWTASADFTPPAPIYDYQRHQDGVSVSELVDINGDGLVDWVQSYVDGSGAVNKVYINNGSDWVYDASASLPLVLSDLTDDSTPKQRAEFIDINGDALPDIVSSYRSVTGALVKQTWLNTQSGWQSSADFVTPDVLIDYQLFDKGAATGFFLDINNDGLSDFVSSYVNASGSSVRATWLNTGSGWQSSATLRLPIAIADYSVSTPIGQATPVDINGDGLLDIVQAHQNTGGAINKKVWLNTGNGWKVNADLAPPAVAWQQAGNTVQTRAVFADVSNDGLPDFVESYTSSSGNSNRVWRNLGDGWLLDDALALPVFLSVINPGTDSRAKAIMFDANSDGRGDVIGSAGGSSSTVYLGGLNGSDYAMPEVVTHFTDGLGNAYGVEYSPATKHNVYTPYNDGTYPNLDVAGPMLLVAAVESSVGTTTTSRAEHFYFGKKVNVRGRGDLGFARKIAVDTRSNVRIESQFSQEWPFVGSPISTVKKTGTNVILMEGSNTYATKSLFGGKTFMVYQSHKSSTDYELDGQEIATTTNLSDDFDEYGNSLSTSTTKVYRGSTSPTTYTSSKTNTYTNSETNWYLGRLDSVTETVSAPNTPTISSQTAFTYDSDRNLYTKTIRPNKPEAVTETYLYDDFGHIRSTTVNAEGVESRTSTATYTADGRFAKTATNPLGHVASSEYHPFFGQVVRTEGPNGSISKKIYDDHGRMIKSSNIRTADDEENAADHGSNVIVFTACSSENNCPNNAAYFLGVVDNEGESPETVYYDNRNREVRKQTFGFQPDPDLDALPIYIDTEYDEYGRKHRVSKPYFADAATIYWTTYEYDLLGRLSRVVTAANKYVTSEYFVGKTIVTNPLGQIKTTFVNGQGKPVKVIDTMGKALEYTYDAAGRLLTTVANSNESTQITIEYDDLGRKIKQIDPDLGEWEYRYDNYGQLIWQQDAKDQVVTMEYDKLGRITQRTEVEGVTNWDYDSGLNALGKLSRVWNDQGYDRTHSYDEYGRPIEVTTTIDGDSTTIKTAYHHSTDKVAYVEYPSGLKIAKEFTNEGFPLEIRSTSEDFKDRYLEAEGEAIRLAKIANDYQEETKSSRDSWLATFEAEKAASDALDATIKADEQGYRSTWPGYNHHIQLQTAAINEAKHYERWGNSFRETAAHFQKFAIIHAHGAEIAIDIIETREPNWASMRYPELDIDEHDIIEHMAGLWGVTSTTLGYAFKRGTDKETGAKWAEQLAQEAERLGAIAQKEMNEATARYEQVKIHIAAAEAHAATAERFYNHHLKGFVDRIESNADLQNSHILAANEAAEEISAIDNVLKPKVDAAVNAQRQAAALKNYHDNEASELHWAAISADAEGKVTEFTQGKHVSTHVAYEESTGRLHGVMSESTPEAFELEAGQTIPSLSNKLNEFITDLQSTKSDATAHAAESLDQLNQTQTLINALDPNDQSLSPAMALAAQAQIDALQVNQAVFNTDYQLNDGISTLASSMMVLADHISGDFDGLEHTTNNILIYSARVHATIASYHNQLKGLYEVASQQQTQKATDVNGLGTVDANFLQEYAELGTYHQSISSQHQTRADAITVADGSDASNPELYGLARASFRQKRLIDRHADISNKRRRLNVALFAPLQHLNNASLEKHTALGTTLASHFAENKMMGRSERARFRQLERLYRERLAVLEADESEDEDLFANDTERKALYQYLTDVNAELGAMYTGMSDQSYWDQMFNGFAESLNSKSAIYDKLASNHHQLAANNELLASKSGEQYNHTLYGSDDTILSDTYTWDDLGNLKSRDHGAANLTEAFDYDALNRLEKSTISGSSTMLYELAGNNVVTYEYDALGNITFKSDVGSYDYGANAGPHAVTSITGDANLGHKNTTYQYDANGNMISGDGRQIAYTSFNKPKKVLGDGNPTDFVYGPERQLVKQVEQTGVVPKTTLYLGNQYEKIFDGYKVTEKYHLSTSNGATIAVIIDKEDETPKTHYLHRDHLDSIVAITNETGHVVDRFFYDAFGKQLTALDTSGNEKYTSSIESGLTDRGFTGHRMIQSGLVHMGGRVFDSTIGRFLSADPHIQFAGNLQNYNRYSYVNNNPLSFNDPSGYFISSVFKALKKLFKKIVKIIRAVHKLIKKVVKFVKENLRVVIAVVAAVAVPIAAGFILGGAGVTTVAGALSWVATSASIGTVAAIGAIAGGLSSLIATGSLTAALKGAAFGAITGAVAFGFRAGNVLANTFGSAARTAQVAAHGIIGGVRAKIDGMSFSKGFLSAAVAKALTPAAVDAFKNDVFVQGLAVATVGGIASSLAGGSFEHGFLAAGVAFAANQLASSRKWVNPTGKGVRGQDGYGCGSYQKCTRVSGGRRTPHQGTDYKATAGQDVKAVTDGTVIKTNAFTGRDLSLHHVLIETSDGHIIRQGYIDASSLTVSPGDAVSAGQVLGTAGSLQVGYPPTSSGGVMSDHIHIDIRQNGNTLNPESLIPPGP